VQADACFTLLRSLPGVSRELCAQAQLQPSGAQSVQGHPLLQGDVLPPSKISKPTRVLVIGGIHGDELSSVSLALQWM
jgi:predicted deacylase